MNATQLNQQIDDIITFIRKHTSIKPQIGISLGNALSEVSDVLEETVIIPYNQIPHLPKNVSPITESGNLILGKLNGKFVIMMQGRFLLFEGHNPQIATILIRVMSKMGAKTLLILSVAGGLNYHFRVGEIMLITDHVNFTGISPLIGNNLDNFGPRFLSMFDIYDTNLQQLAKNIATENRINLCQGVYIGILGPEFPTRAELRLMIENNNDAVGLSVVHEAIIATHCDMKILGLIIITDMALPYAIKQATMDEITKQAHLSLDKIKLLLKEIIKKYDDNNENFTR